ncbi:DUF5818 domain-containing protein [Novosphingobium sp. SL115]|uniref:DUF5818 domain-containing protein n=1 Tax=Novosphingobium sp. SL115 TaxID=2995150 RepID=UPI002272DB19|nr:DUF5818 domain-containing protein [Novosphingobium sp. SL115]MCY1669604.1 DUF5818 domain-containing protein [Novosphingobium sp. SL115]
MSPTSITISGILEAGARGYLLRDDDGVVWRLDLELVDQSELLCGERVVLRAYKNLPDQLAVEFVARVTGEHATKSGIA